MADRRQTLLARAEFRTDQLQFLRFLAFLNVFIAHAEQWLFFKYPAHHCAAAAVSFFFVLSGLVTGYYAYGKKTELSFKAQGRYMWKKVRKIYPLYALVLIYPFVYSGLAGVTAAGDYAVVCSWLKRLGCNLLFLQSWFPVKMGYNGSWFMSSLMFLYLFNLPFIWLLNKINRNAKRFWLLAGAMFGVWVMLLAYCFLTRSLDLEFWQYIFPPARLGEYLVGMIFGFMLRVWRPRLALSSKTWRKMIFTVLEVAVIFYWFRCLSRLGNYWRNQSERWLLPNLLLLGVFTIGEGWVSALFRWKPLVRLGDASFACYLIHKVLIMQFRACNVIPEDSQAGKMVSFLFCLLFSVSVALLLEGKKRTAKPVPQ